MIDTISELSMDEKLKAFEARIADLEAFVAQLKAELAKQPAPGPTPITNADVTGLIELCGGKGRIKGMRIGDLAIEMYEPLPEPLKPPTKAELDALAKAQAEAEDDLVNWSAV
jgi:hypothetical protein